MTTKILPKDKSLSRFFVNLPVLDDFARGLLFSKLKGLSFGTLDINDADKVHRFGSDPSFTVRITVRRSSFYSRTLFGGSIGNAESYIDGDWECADLTGLVRLFVRNRHVLQGIDGSLSNLVSPIQTLFHGLRANTIDGSRKNIRSHYDIGNDFFKLFLDPSMMYSSAVFASKDTTLEEAAMAKVKLICEKLNLRPEHHLIEIGTGWGTLAIFAAQTHGCKVTTTTISKEQFDYVTNRVIDLGLTDKVTVLFEDYRNLRGTYDRLVSIEMIEAVGLEHLDTFFEVCSKLLKPDGLMVLQSITIRDQFYDEAKRSVDFIQRHIFPGGAVPAIHAMLNSVKTKTDFALISQEDFAEDYAETLYHWDQRLSSNTEKIHELGFPDFLPRLWHFYFAYCEGGFRERAIGLSQMILAKPQYKHRSFR